MDVIGADPTTFINTLQVTSDFGTSLEVTAEVSFAQIDYILLAADEHLAYRPDPRIYRDAETRSPKTGRRLLSWRHQQIFGDSRESEYLDEDEWY